MYNKMSELHTLAYISNSHPLGWDFHNLGIVNSEAMSLVMDGISPSFSPPLFDFPTGYLEDALVEFSDRSKHRRLELGKDRDNEHKSCSNNDILQNYCNEWNLSTIWHQPQNFYCMNQMETSTGTISEKHRRTSMTRKNEETKIPSEIKTTETTSSSEGSDSSFSSYKDPPLIPTDKQALATIDHIAPSSGGGRDRRNKRVITRVVYPFALVKPGGTEGEVTLNDINKRILMPPTRPVRHPVGDFACRPCVALDGPGLSGKLVVALTRIHTQGRGSITIIRTKG